METRITSVHVELVVIVQSDDPAFSYAAAHEAASKRIAEARPNEKWEYVDATLVNYDEWECHYERGD